SPPAPPCPTLSARLLPMWWISMSLNRFAVAWPRLEVIEERAVFNDGVWQRLQPTALNRLLPFAIDVDPPGVVVDGVGGARSRMNIANPTVSLSVPVAVV